MTAKIDSWLVGHQVVVKSGCCRMISGFTDRSSGKSTSYQTCIVIGKEGVYLNGIFRYT